MPGSLVFVVDASVVVRWLIDGPFAEECQAFLDRCSELNARLLAPTCLYSEVANALYKLCLARPPAIPLSIDVVTELFRTIPDFEIALVDRALQLPSGDIALTPQWVQTITGGVYVHGDVELTHLRQDNTTLLFQAVRTWRVLSSLVDAERRGRQAGSRGVKLTWRSLGQISLALTSTTIAWTYTCAR